MEPINSKNYFQHKEYLSFHDIKNFQKCEFLYAEDKAGKVERFEYSFFKLGHAFDSMITGDFSHSFVVGKDPKKTLEQNRNARAKAEEARKKYEGATDKRSQASLAKAIVAIEECQAIEQSLENETDKEAITETVYEHVTAMVKALERQTLMKHFPQDKNTNQTVLTTKIGGKAVKGMLDYFHQGNAIIADYKTTAQMAKLDPATYIGQLTWYRMLAKKVHNIDCDCYLIIVDKTVNIKHVRFVKISKETMDRFEQSLLDAVELIKEAEELGLYEPRAFENMHVCYNCDHYGNCPHTIQTEFDVI